MRDPNGALVAMLNTTNPSAPSVGGYYLVDDQDSVMALINPAGTSATRYLYEPYGEQVRTWVDPSPGTASSLGTEATASAPAVDHNPWRYASGYYDRDTGFLKFGTRYYMPAHATWTQPDPQNGQLRQPVSLNRFGYAAANPTNLTDTNGRAWWNPFSWDTSSYSLQEAAMGFAGFELMVGGLETIAAGAAVATIAGGGPIAIAVGLTFVAAGVGVTALGLHLSCTAADSC